MADAPELSDFRARYGTFADVPDATVEAFLTDAAAVVSHHIPDDWLDKATMLIACHELMLEGHGDAEEASFIRARQAGVLEIKDGATGVKLTSSKSDGESQSPYASTSYGRRYLDMLQQVSPIGYVV